MSSQAHLGARLLAPALLAAALLAGACGGGNGSKPAATTTARIHPFMRGAFRVVPQ